MSCFFPLPDALHGTPTKTKSVLHPLVNQLTAFGKELFKLSGNLPLNPRQRPSSPNPSAERTTQTTTRAGRHSAMTLPQLAEHVVERAKGSSQNPTYASESSYAAVRAPPALPVLTTPTGSIRTA